MAIIKKLALVVFLVFAVNSYGQKPDQAFIKKVEKTAGVFKIKDPVVSDPVSVDAQLIWNKSKTQLAVIVKAKVFEGWRIYAYVPPTQPYIQYQMVLELPKGVTALEDWLKPKPYPYEDNIFIYKGELTFIRYFSVKDLEANAKIKAGLFYQTCDIKQCLPPNTKSKELKL
ncbi:protein-disulfide reductase DsbD domain-containing protein [Flavobacterium sp.]|uniref:protein-disulfide reductase DsbD domain-containing protein n=1 Tax=Flavobacterium sp. TaxID=239 RepID=UPI002D8DCFB8|nr:protein-disulfide reductase DsbD domain-containing protein [Flavobacterium sp.]